MMTTPPLDLPALREQVRRAKSASCACHPAVAIHPDELTALLDRVEELAGESYLHETAARAATTRAEAAEAKMAAVRELHALDTHVCECGDTHGPYCKTCQYDYPCPTIQALDGTP